MDPTAHDQLQLKVVDFSGNTLEFKIKSHTALKKLMSTFCERAGLDLQSVRFIFDGQRVNGSDTAHSLGMEEGNVIEVMQEQPCKLEQKMNEKFNMQYQKIYLQLQDLKEDIKATARAPECPVCIARRYQF